jgi:rare lipoprotein A (peptidoglycan hydrolase)
MGGRIVYPRITTALLLLLWLLGPGICPAAELSASWYSTASLHKEGTWRYSSGRMANGQRFRDDGMTCASWDYPLGTVVCIRYAGKSVRCIVTDRTARRFQGKRIDLSVGAFSRLADRRVGIIHCTIEEVGK